MKTVKFEGMNVRLDRPKGFVQEGKDKEGKHWKRVYKYDYGFIPKTKGGDGDGLDVFLGPDEEKTNTAYWVLQKKDDGSFDEYKVFLGFKDKNAAKKAYGEHIPLKYFGGIFAVSIPMMHALLGIEPLAKLAMFLGFCDELEKLGGICGLEY